MSSIDGRSRGGVFLDGIMTSPHEFSPLDILERSRADWNREARACCRWRLPVDHATISRARSREWEVVLTPNIPVPRAWFGETRGRDALCLASGGGQSARAGRGRSRGDELR